MATHLLYREDAYIKEFTATVLECEKVDKGFNVILDKTCFYPEGGGQPCDLGVLNDVPVIDVKEKGECVVHLCTGELKKGTCVTGKIDWERRFNHMQHHSGEHIVSGIINNLYHFDNVGFHMGETVTIDFNGELPLWI